jgi:PAS domain S-box-containing protein
MGEITAGIGFVDRWIGMLELNNKTVPQKNSEKLQLQIDEQTAELAKTRFVLWNEMDKRRKAEQVLHELEEMHYRILEAIDFGILIADRDGNIIETNNCMEKMTGYTTEELCKKGLIALSTNQDHRRKLCRLFSSPDSVRNIQTPLKRKNDTICTVSLNINRTELKGRKVLIARVQDITAWKNSEKTLQESMDYRDQIINHVADPIFVIDRKKRLIHVNDALCAFTGMSYEELVGSSAYAHMPPQLSGLFFEQDEEIFKTGRECITENKIVDGKGDTHNLITKRTLLVKKNGEIQIVGILQDVTEYKRLEERFLQAQKKVK